MNRFVHAAVLSTAMLVAGQAGAAPIITLDIVDADWVNYADGENVVVQNGDPGDIARIRWGGVPDMDPFASGSNYTFDPSAPGPVPVTEDVPFSLGDFTHNNFAIPLGTAITGVDLQITLDLTIDSLSNKQGPFKFIFAHFESPNTQTPLDNPANNDLITVTNTASPVTFIFDGREYTLSVLGFGSDSGSGIEFSTKEGFSNTAPLIAKITSRQIDVPTPETLPLIGLVLLGAGTALRRRN